MEMPSDRHHAPTPGPWCMPFPSMQSLFRGQTLQKALKRAGQKARPRHRGRPGQGALTGGCHISSAGSGLLCHMYGCTCSRCPRGSSLRPRAPGWASCSHTPPLGTTETQRFRAREKPPHTRKPLCGAHVTGGYFGVCVLANPADVTPTAL